MAISRFLEGLSEYISSLSPERQEGLVRSLVRRAINEDLDVDKSFDLFQRRGFSLSRDRFDNIYTNTEQRELNSQRVKYLRRFDKPSEDILYPSFTLEDSRYNFGFEYQIYDETDDEYHTKFFFIETNELRTRGNLENMASQILIGLYGRKEGDITDVKLRYGEINVKSIR